MLDIKNKAELIEFIKEYMYIEVPHFVGTKNEPIDIYYCINYRGNVYRTASPLHLSLLSDKAEKLANAISQGVTNDDD